MFNKIAREFGRNERVKSLYIQRYRKELQILIFLSINHYDFDLMDTLLEIEYDIREKYPKTIFEFFYPPVGISHGENLIHPQAQCLYERNHDKNRDKVSA